MFFRRLAQLIDCVAALYACEPPHSGQNFADFGIGLPQFMQNLVSAEAAAAGAAGAGAGPDGS
jgi:hypothetical protein